MKKILLVLFGFAISLTMFAVPVNPEQASKIAKNFYLQMSKDKGSTNVSLTLVYTSTSKDVSTAKGFNGQETPVLYIFNVNQNDGFVIVSADNAVTPILGYTLKGTYTDQHRPIAFIKLLEKYKKEITFIISNNLEADEVIKTKWRNLDSGKPLDPSKDTKSVNPLCATTWNQNPYENQMCPADPNGSNGHAVTGCPATAMAQIMKYWNYPTTGTSFHSYSSQNYGTLSADFGSTTYDWGSMPNNLTGPNNAVALLMFHCGVSVEMNYGPDESASYVIISGAPTPAQSSEYAYKTYFGYNSSTIQGLKRDSYSDADWKQFLKTDLDANRPIQYAGFGTNGGHTFVCDGYDNNDFFHMNWGWGGNSDGFFDIDALNPGSLGTGGGAGGFNSGQQAVIGIQPNSVQQNYNLQVYSAITVNPNPINFAQAFSVSTDIANYGSVDFTGDFCAALFNSQGVFIDYIQTLTGTITPSTYSTTTFSTSGMTAPPDNYIISIFSRPTGGSWTLVNQATFTNPVSITITGPYNDVQMYTNASISPNPVIQNQAVSISASIANAGTSDINCSVAAYIYNLDGTFAQTVEVKSAQTLQSGYYYNFSFNSSNIDLTPGTYLLVFAETPDGTNWYYVGGTSYPNPIYINVVGQPLSPDVYEQNNTEATAYNLPMNFSGNTASVNTTGSNIHIGTDVDYYQLNLPLGYNYTITARVDDSYNSGNGQTYTCDVIWSYKTGSTLSDVYDDVMPNNIQISNGGTIIFGVSPYISGATGTYLFEMSITQTVGIKEIDALANSINLYPNPAQNSVNLDLSNFNQKISTVKVMDNIGQEINNYNQSDFSGKIYNIPLNNLPDGLYFVNIISDNKVFSKKFTIQK